MAAQDAPEPRSPIHRQSFREIEEFDKSKLKQADTQEKVQLPTTEGKSIVVM